MMPRPIVLAFVACAALSLAALPRPLPSNMTLKQCRDEINVVLDPLVASLQGNVATLTNTVNTQTATIATRDATIVSLTSQLAAKDATIAGHLATIASRDATISGLQSTVAQRDATIAGFAPTLAAKEAELATCETRVDALVDPLQDWLNALGDEGITLDIIVPEPVP